MDKGTGGKNGGITEVTLDIKKPKIFDGENAAQFKTFTERGFDIPKLKTEGYDAAILKFKDGKDDVVVFSPNQIKVKGGTPKK